MKNKTAALSALSVCISLALNGQALAQTPPPATVATAETLECPADLSLLTAEEQAALAEQCQAAEQLPEETLAAQVSELPAWMTDQTTLLAGGGAAALAATIAIAAGGSSGGGGSGGDRNEGGDGNNYEEWEIGNKLEGDNQENTLEGNTSAGEGEIGNLVTGNNTDNTLEGNTDVTEGGKGTVVDGNNTSTTNDGEVTVSGEGSVGLEVNGNNATVTNNGNGDITAGGTGVSVNGDNASVTNTGETSVSGQGSAGTVITGDNATVSNEGNSSVTGGGTGTLITGDNASVSNTGDTSVSGEGSTGIVINGNGSEVTLGGDLWVTGGATGVLVAGNKTVLENHGNITVQGTGSVGVDVSGASSVFTNIGDIRVAGEASGVNLSGNGATVTLDGNILVDATEQRLAATGVNITSNNGALVITGNVQVDDLAAVRPGDRENTTPDLTGVAVSGNGNQVRIDGLVSVNYAGMVDSRPVYGTTRYGVQVAGDNNTLVINGGLAVDYTAEYISSSWDTHNHGYQYALHLSGSGNTVRLSGESQFHNNGFVASFGAAGETGVLYSSGENNTLVLDENFRLEAFSTGQSWYSDHNLFKVGGEGSVLYNRGHLVSEVTGGVLHARSGARIVNEGSVTALLKPGNSQISSTSALVTDGHNLAGGKLVVSSWLTPFESGHISAYGGIWAGNQYAAMAGGGLVNEGSISIRGAATYGMTSAFSNLLNSGTIEVDGMQLLLDEDGTDSGNKQLLTVMTGNRELRGTGMYIYSSGTATNTGTITVSNSGTGMFVNGSGVAYNQGTINLEADGSHNEQGWLYAMAATGNGVAINDTTGVININTDLGQAFYTAGNGVIVNRGTVNFNGSPINSGAPNWGSEEFDGTLYDRETLLSHTGESVSTTENIFYLATLDNQGNLTVDHLIRSSSDWLQNSGTLAFTENGSFSGRLHNTGEVVASGGLDVATLVNEGTVTINNGRTLVSRAGTGIYNLAGGTITNGAASGTGSRSLMHLTNSSTVYNNGDLTATDGYNAMYIAGSSKAWNDENGRITVTEKPTQYGGAAVSMVGNAQFYNLGEISVQGSNAVMFNMTGAGNVVVNAGVMNIGTEAGVADGTNGTGLIGVKQSAANVFNNMAGGVINIWADNSYAFEKTNSNARVINNGDVFVHGVGSDIFKGSATATEGDDLLLAELPSIPDVPGMPEARWNVVNNYTVGTNADGSAGTMSGSYLALDGSVKVDTGFVAGTAEKEVTFSNVFKAQAVTGEQHIGSTTVVWNASASKNADGNVDVTMTKNDYAEVITDKTLSGVAAALDNGYTSNSLYSSLNVSTAAELDRALKQVSGAQATALNQEARILGQRFTRLAAEAPVTTDTGLSFNVVAKGDKRAEMANKVTYDMVALGQRFESGFGELEAHYGMARLSGSGGNAMSRAGDNGLTGGYSQFFGLSHHLNLGDNLGWHNSLRYDRHQLDSRRDIRFEGVRNSARSDVHIQQLALRSEGAKTLHLGDNLHVKPFAGVALRHQMTGGMQERGAGDFNLSMQRYTETAVDAVTGLHLNWSGDRGWGAQAVLEAGPNLAFSRQGRTASLAGASGQQFRVEDGKRGGGVNRQATAGAHYRQGSLDIGANAFHWREDGAQDKGFLLNLTHHF